MEPAIDTSRFGIVIVDMQDYFLKNLEKKEKQKLLEIQENFIEICRTRNYPVLALEYEGFNSTISSLQRRITTVPRHKFMEKSFNNGFLQNPELELILKDSEIEQIGITGVNAEYCVLETICGAIRKGFRVITSRELIASSRGQKGIEEAEEEFNKLGVVYLPYEELINKIK